MLLIVIVAALLKINLVQATLNKIVKVRKCNKLNYVWRGMGGGCVEGSQGNSFRGGGG